MRATLSPAVSCVLVTFSCFLAAFPARAQGLLLNASFDGTPLGAEWTTFGGAEVRDKIPGNLPPEAYDGKYSMYTPANDLDLTSGAYQTYSASPGSQYTFTGHVLHSVNNSLGDGSYGIALIQFLDASSETPIGSSQAAGLVPTYGDWASFNVDGTAPAGTTRVRFSVNTYVSEWPGGGLYYDALSAEITGVPEVPFTAWLGVGTLAFAAGWKSLRRKP